jgi:DNA (cytosine-5)-methyltransferase 1
MPDHSSTALIHPDEVRCLSVHECAAVQSFGHAMRFAGSPRSQYQQIGNAVPPLLARALGAHLARFLDGEPQPAPDTAMWRKASANRRIGTHGWAVRRRLRTAYQMNVAVRPDHVWSTVQADLCLA